MDQFFMYENENNLAQCMLCNSTFKSKRLFNLEKHFLNSHKDIAQLEFSERENKLTNLKKMNIYKAVDNEERRQQIKKASFVVALYLANKGRPFDDGVFFKNLGSEFFSCFGNKGYDACRILESVPLSRTTIVRRTEQISSYIFTCSMERLRNCMFFSLSFDETTDTNNICQLIVCAKSVGSNFEIAEEVLIVISLHKNVTGETIYKAVEENVLNLLDVEKLSSICTDGARVMVGKTDGLVGYFYKNNINIPTFHCIIHQQALFAKKLNIVKAMDNSIKIINKIKGGHHALSHRKFKVFLEELSAEYQDLLLYTEVRWLSRGKSIQRLFDLKDEVLLFLKELNDEESLRLADIISDKDFQLDLAFLSDITGFINELNLALQGKNKFIFDLINNVGQFKRKLNIMISELKEKKVVSLPRTEELMWETGKVSKLVEYVEVLESIITNFNQRFKDFEKISDIIILHDSPLTCQISQQKEALHTELRSLQKSVTVPLGSGLEFWKNLDSTLYTNTKNEIYKLYSMFGSTYNCEAAFSNLKIIQNKYRNHLTDKHICDLMRIKNYDYEIDIDKIIE